MNGYFLYFQGLKDLFKLDKWLKDLLKVYMSKKCLKYDIIIYNSVKIKDI